MALMFRAALIAGALAGTTLFAVPAAAAPLSARPALGSPSAVPAHSRFDPASSSADWRCRWNCGWGRGWGPGWGWDRGRGWRRNRIDAGDVIIGAAIIGGIAAILSSENRRRRERDVVVIERDPDLRDRDWRDDRRARPIGTAGAGTSGLDNAAAICVDAVERDARVDSVDNVSRNASGWDVTGTLGGGQGFRCRIGNDGRVAAIDYDESLGAVADDGQWSADAYAAARERIGGTVRPDIAVQEATFESGRGAVAARPLRPSTDRMPAYPGGPIPGEEIPENAPDALPGG